MFSFKALSMVVVAIFLIGIGALTPLSAPNHDQDHEHGVHSVVADARQHVGLDENNPPPKHDHSNHQGNCHSLACSSAAVFMVSISSVMSMTGQKIPLPPVAFIQGQPIPPSKRPPKLIV